MEKEKSLPKLKKEYKKIQEKHNLPEFEELNKDFGIEKLAEIETDYLIRELRKFVAEKISGYFRFVETLLNPANAPMFVYSFVKSYTEKEKDVLREIYKKVAEKEIDMIELDLEYNEEKEAEFIKDSFKLWQEIKIQTKEIVNVVKKNWNNKSQPNGKGYFG